MESETVRVLQEIPKNFDNDNWALKAILDHRKLKRFYMTRETIKEARRQRVHLD